MLKQKKSTQKRSKLNTTPFIKWIRTRFNNEERKNNRYLYFPQELVKQTSIEKIFVEFDVDGSGGLSRDEVFDMFHLFNIQITMDDLNQLYDSVQPNLEELDCNMFKKCALSEESNKVFREIVRNMEGEGYYPHNFINMIIYIVYLSKREELRKGVLEPSQPITQRVQKLSNLLCLDDLALNNEQLKAHTELFKQNLRNQFKTIWEQVNEKYNDRFPLNHRLEEQFHNYVQNKYKQPFN